MVNWIIQSPKSARRTQRMRLLVQWFLHVILLPKLDWIFSCILKYFNEIKNKRSQASKISGRIDSSLDASCFFIISSAVTPYHQPHSLLPLCLSLSSIVNQNPSISSAHMLNPPPPTCPMNQMQLCLSFLEEEELDLNQSYFQILG